MANILGDEDDDVLVGTLNSDEIIGAAGDDTINGGSGDDYIRGDGFLISTDRLPQTEDAYCFSYDDMINGGSGNDSIFGDLGDDSANGGAGNDYMNGGAGGDTLIGGAGNDNLQGDDVSLIIITIPGDSGGGGAQAEVYGDVSDYLPGNDSLDGGQGDETLNGGMGNDTHLGGGGKDVFEFNGGFQYYPYPSGAQAQGETSPLYAIGHDIILDFLKGADKIKFVGTDLDFCDIKDFWHVVGKDVVLYDDCNPQSWSITIRNGVPQNLGESDFCFVDFQPV